MRKMLFAMILFVVVDAVWLLTAGRYALAMTERIQGSPVTFRFAAAIPSSYFFRIVMLVKS